MQNLQDKIDQLMTEVKILKETNIDLIKLLDAKNNREQVNSINLQNVENISFDSTTSVETVIEKTIIPRTEKKT